jgi:taurine dioxygenase
VRIYKSPSSPNDRYENAWHADATWREKPPMGCVAALRGRPAGRRRHDVGQHGARLREAAGASQAADRALRARHSIEATFGAAMPIEKRLALKAQFPIPSIPSCARIRRPARRCCSSTPSPTHFTNFHNAQNVRYGQDYAPGAAQLLQYLVSQAQVPEYQVRFRWRPNSMAMWDNRSTQHYAVMDYPPCHRKMERAGIVGDKPF